MKFQYKIILKIHIRFAYHFEILLNNKFQFQFSMTKILTGMTFAVILLVLGMSSQSFAMQMPDKTQNEVLNYAMTKDATLGQLVLVSDSPVTKGGKTVFHLIPKPQEGQDGIQIATQTDSPELVLASIPTPQGGTMLKLVPKIQEGIDGIIMPKSNTLQGNSPQLATTNITTGGGTMLKLIPTTQEGIDGIIMPKSAETPMMIIAEPPTSKGGMSVLHLVPKSAPNAMDSSS